jgi:TonB family protein
MTGALIDALSTPLTRAIGLALFEFMWQGAVIGIATALILIVLQRRTPQARYVVACLGLAMMCVAPISTVVNNLPPRTAPRPDSPAAPTLRSPSTTVFLDVPDAPISASRDARPAWLEPRLPYVVLIWIGGVSLLTLHLFHGWFRVRRIHRSATALEDDRWAETVRVMAERVGVLRPLRLLQSRLVDVPSVIGCVRPAIFIPIGAVTGLSAADLEAILAHELAHIRRADYLVNVIQCGVETLLFYHPAVWWVSKQIRRERELCCDDVAATLCSSRLGYARALASLAELHASAPKLAMAANGDELLTRIRRLVEPGAASGPKLSGGIAMSVVLTVLLLSLNGQISRANDAPTPAVHVPAAVVVPAAPRVEPHPVPVQERRATRQKPVSPTIVVIDAQGAVQTGLSAIRGVVIDADGGRIPGAHVTIVSTDRPTPWTMTITTDTRGEFVAADLAAGAYSVTVAISGFRTGRSRIQIAPNETASAKIVLEVGTLTEFIVVGVAQQGAGTTPVSRAPRNDVATDLDSAKALYAQGRLAEAELMTARALEALRASTPVAPAAAPQTFDRGGPVRIGGSINPPRKIKDVKPIYPADAAAAGVTGTVILEAVMAKDGSVRNIAVLRSIPLLDQAAVDAVRQWMFTPTLLNGVPVEITMTVSVTFEARRN